MTEVSISHKYVEPNIFQIFQGNILEKCAGEGTLSQEKILWKIVERFQGWNSVWGWRGGGWVGGQVVWW